MNNGNASAPRVSVLMPAFNAEAYIAEAMQSILGQSFQDFEFLITDDHSTDGTCRIIEGFSDPRIKFVKKEVNRGYLKAANELMALATGEYITFQDADDWSAPDRLEVLVNAFVAGGSLCGSNIHYVDAAGNRIGGSDFPVSSQLIRVKMQNNEYFPFCGASVMIKRKVYEDIGGYREFFDRVGSEDLDWIYRISEHYEVRNVPQQLYFYRRHIQSICNQVGGISPLAVFSGVIAHEQYLCRMAGEMDRIDRGDGKILIQECELKAEKFPDLLALRTLNILLANGERKEALYEVCIYWWRNRLNFKAYLITLAVILKAAVGRRTYNYVRNNSHFQRVVRRIFF